MKYSKIILFIFIFVFSLFAKSCGDDHLDQPALGSLDGGVLADETGVNTLLIGAYGALSQTGSGGWGTGISGGVHEVSPSNWLWGSVTAVEAHKGSDAGDGGDFMIIGSFTFDANHNYINNKFSGLYYGISRANSVLQVLPDVPITATFTELDKSRIEAEARFIRAHFYFELRRFFYRVPWIDEETDAVTPQPNDQEIWPMIEADFQFAWENLPETQNEVGRVNNWAAASYLAKVYMYQDKFTEAKELFDQIIVNGVTSNGLPYELVPLDQIHNPIYKNHSESIFAIQSTADDGTGGINNSNTGMMLTYPYNSPFRCCGFFQPTQYLVNAFQTEDGLPNYNDHLSSEVVWDLGILSNEQFDPHQGDLDPRLDWTVGRRGVPFHDWNPHPGFRWIREQSHGGPYNAKKHIWWRKDDQEVNNPRSWAPGSSYNIPIIRFADVLLMAAEAEVEIGSLETARDYVNRVRERAADSSAWVRNEFNQGYAADIVDNEADMLNTSVTSGNWVVREDLGTTFVFLGGDSGNIENWNEYPDPFENYNIDLYNPEHFSSQNEAREIVRFERLLELALEGHRFFDLVRWGIAEEEINAAMEYEAAFFPSSYKHWGRFQSDKNEYFPIPQRQIDLSTIDGVPQLQQNPGY